jgi:hypothetical protein
MQAFEAKPAPLFRDPDGTIRVSGTRVSVETLVFAFDSGAGVGSRPSFRRTRVTSAAEEKVNLSLGFGRRLRT